MSMLHYYAFSNFQSFPDRTEVSLRLTDKAAVRGWDAPSPSGHRLSLAMAVLGPNGAGKTALLKPLAFLAWFVRHSFSGLEPEALIPVTPFFGSEQPSEFELEAEDSEGVLWRYVLRATPSRVLHESLYRKRERFNYVFVRDWDPDRSTYAVKQQDFGMATSEAQKVRANASLISTAAQYGVETAAHIASLRFLTNITVDGKQDFDRQRVLNAAEFFAHESSRELQVEMTRLLRSWDFGLDDVRLDELTVPATASREARKVWLPIGVHRLRNGDLHDLPFMDESRGTQAAFVLLSMLLPALAGGGVVAVDEFESDLHPLMLEPILDLFANPKTNPHNAQIIFTCHSVEVLNLLHKAQISLVEKINCESTAWRLDSMQGVRSDDNFYAKYMAGAYGAVPQV